MRKPPFKCLFCLSKDKKFTKVEHPIPESLGNDDLVLEPGYVCDSCNQYFGSKIEKKALECMPLSGERIRLNVQTKKGKSPKLFYPNYFEAHATSYRDTVTIFAPDPVIKHIASGKPLIIPKKLDEDFIIVRFLLKMGLELHVIKEDLDLYSNKYDPARKFARNPKKTDLWEYAIGRYPNIDDLVISKRVVDEEEWITDQLYRFESGIMKNGDLVFCFMYRDHVMAVNLSRPHIDEYLSEFNLINEFSLTKFRAKRN